MKQGERLSTKKLMSNLPILLGKIANRTNTEDDSGSVLVIIIISIVIIASIGTAIYTTSSSNMYTQIGSVDSLNGYFLAESGRFYALTYIYDDIDDGRESYDDSSGSVRLLNGKTFTLPDDTGKFKINLSMNNGNLSDCNKVSHNGSPNDCEYELESIGIPNDKTDRRIDYNIDEY